MRCNLWDRLVNYSSTPTQGSFAELAIGCRDSPGFLAGEAFFRMTGFIELKDLYAIAPEPLAGSIVPFGIKTDSHAAFQGAPELQSECVPELLLELFPDKLF